jgi:hypothetical protein
MPRLALPRRHALAALCAAALALPLMVGHAAGPRPPVAAPDEPALATIAPTRLLAEAAMRTPAAKIATDLTTRLAGAGAVDPVLVIVRSAERLNLAGFGRVLRQWSWPAGERLALVEVPAGRVTGLAALPGVASLESGDPAVRRPVPDGPDEGERQAYAPIDGAAVRARLDAAPAWATTAARIARQADGAEAARQAEALGKGAPRPAGWHDIGKGHAAREAWSLGYMGEGVKVAVLDTSVDFAMYDLQGTWATLPPGHPYAGWPQVYDPYSTYLFTLDAANAANPNWAKYSRTGIGGLIELYQESPVVQQDVGGQMALTACVRPLAQIRDAQGQTVNELLPENCATKVPASKSGKVRYGHHSDALLAAYGSNAAQNVLYQYAGVLLVDANQAGVYDTVYVDLNFDNDFTDDKPMTRDDPLSWRDIDGDNIADISGGLLYYVADGQRPIPGAYLWEDAQNKLPVPAAGTFVAIHSDTGQHGTLCASNIVSQGRLGVPPGRNVRWRNNEKDPALNANGEPESVNPGMAPKAKVVSIGDYYSGPQAAADSAWRYGVFGDDPNRTDEDIQITSNSYGYSSEDADHWDRNGRFIDYYVRKFNSTVSFMKSTGNGGPGYGTTTAPSPHVAMGIAASTQMGSTGWDSMYETSQITYGDIITWSDRGPGADGSNGVTVATDGAYAAGGSPINFNGTNKNLAEQLRSGVFANSTWGGTSRSSPVASGLLALSYQAFRQANGRWPTWEEARAIFQAGSRFAGYDTLVQGSGVADAADSARIAAGKSGVYALPSSWTPGDYRGQRAEAFAKLMAPGGSYQGTFTVKNPSDQPVEVALSGQTLRRVASYGFDWASKDKSTESAYTSMQAPDYLWTIDKAKIPAGTDLMVVRAVQPMEQFDQYPNDKAPDGQYIADNCWRLAVYQHTDWNDDTKLWNDADGDGVVDHVDASPRQSVGLDDLPAKDYAKSEIQEGEYNRFGYATAISNNWALPVHHPLERWKDDIEVALFHRYTGSTTSGATHCRNRPDTLPITDFKFRVDFYQYQDWGWLKLSKATLAVPPKGEATVDATMAVPADAPFGLYQGAVFADHARGAGDVPVPVGGGYELPQKRVVIPVTVNVAAAYDWTGAVTLGGAKANDLDAPYDNGAVRGTFDWGWRAESGDWRFFFVDATSKPLAGTYWLFKTVWPEAKAGQSDIDTRVFRQVSDRFSNPSDPQNAADDWSDPGWYGPGTMGLLARSPYRNLGAGRWAFDTTSGVNEDWVVAPAGAGLHEVMLHNVLFSGHEIELPYETTVSSLRLAPPEPVVYGTACTTAYLTSQMPLPAFKARIFGLSKPDMLQNQSIGQDDPNTPATAGFKKTYDFPDEIASFRVTLMGKTGNDLDLFIMYDANKDGAFDYPGERVGAGANGPDANETATLAGFRPAGKYQVWVHGATVPQATTFDLVVDVVSGSSLKVTGVPEDVEAGRMYALQMCADPQAVAGMTEDMRGVIVLGPGTSPSMLTWPVRWTNATPPKPPTLYLPWLGKGAVPGAALMLDLPRRRAELRR